MTQFLNTRFKIRLWLFLHGVKNYTIEPSLEHDFTVNVQGNVCIRDRGLKSIPVKFGVVSGNFSCDSNHLTDMWGCPEIVGGNFYCGFNRLTSLLGSPGYVGKNFDCSYNKLTSLEGCPQNVGGVFGCSHNQIDRLYHFPKTIGLGFFCENNTLLERIQTRAGEIQDIYEHHVIEKKKLTSLNTFESHQANRLG